MRFVTIYTMIYSPDPAGLERYLMSSREAPAGYDMPQKISGIPLAMSAADKEWKRVEDYLLARPGKVRLYMEDMGDGLTLEDISGIDSGMGRCIRHLIDYGATCEDCISHAENPRGKAFLASHMADDITRGLGHEERAVVFCTDDIGKHLFQEVASRGSVPIRLERGLNLYLDQHDEIEIEKE